MNPETYTAEDALRAIKKFKDCKADVTKDEYAKIVQELYKKIYNEDKKITAEISRKEYCQSIIEKLQSKGFQCVLEPYIGFGGNEYYRFCIEFDRDITHILGESTYSNKDPETLTARNALHIIKIAREREVQKNNEEYIRVVNEIHKQTTCFGTEKMAIPLSSSVKNFEPLISRLRQNKFVCAIEASKDFRGDIYHVLHVDFKN